MKSILQVIGPPGVGKTTLCHALLTYFSESPSSPLKQKGNSSQLSLLVIDASPDQDLTKQFGATS
ncbi:MAG: AAA family ATPase, partial [Cyanobacteria bacterium]|nr:AAA family ATPase [Cyanobacteriota bacterium]